MKHSINSELLQEKIQESGLKLGYISKKMNLSSYGLGKKIKNESEFKVSEMYKLCELLCLSDEERDAIFLPTV